MRYLLLVVLIALVVVLLLHDVRGNNPNPLEESNVALDKTKLAVLPAQLQQVAAALDAYSADRGAYPQDLSELVPEYLPASDLLIDPWGTRLRLERPEAEDAVLACAGPDRTFASHDDTRRSLR